VGKCSEDAVLDRPQGRVRQSRLDLDDDIVAAEDLREIVLNGFPKKTFDPVPLDRLAELLPYHETESADGQRIPDKKNDRPLSPHCLPGTIYSLEIRLGG